LFESIKELVEKHTKSEQEKERLFQILDDLKVWAELLESAFGRWRRHRATLQEIEERIREGYR
jgi:hypothetical protein